MEQAHKEAQDAVERQLQEQINEQQALQQMKEIDFKLQELIPKIKELNQICKELGRDKVRYETAIINEVRPDRTKLSKIIIKVFEDYDNQEEYGQIPSDVFTDDVYMDVRQFYEEAEEEAPGCARQCGQSDAKWPS